MVEMMTIQKNAKEQIRVSFKQYKGHDLVDIRIFAQSDDGKAYFPTAKGVCLSVKKMDELIKGLIIAQDELAKGIDIPDNVTEISQAS